MVAELYGGIAIGFVAVVSVLFAANSAVRAHLRKEQSLRHVKVLTPSRHYRLGIELFLLILGYSNYALFFSFDVEGPAWRFVQPAWLLGTCAFGCVLAARAFCTRIVLDDRGLQLQTPFRTTRLEWQGIQRVTWDQGAWAFHIIGSEAKVSVSVFMVGIRTLINEVERLAPHVELKEVETTLEGLSG